MPSAAMRSAELEKRIHAECFCRLSRETNEGERGPPVLPTCSNLDFVVEIRALHAGRAQDPAGETTWLASDVVLYRSSVGHE
jgi:hypothetical protein